MSSLSLMEWNTKPPTQWDWENLIMFNSSTENPKKLRATEWGFEGEKGMDSGSLYSSGSGSGGSGSGSGSGPDLGLASLSKSSKSASINSSSTGDVKTSYFTLEASEAMQQESNNANAITARPAGASTVESSVGSGEHLLGLKLGKRTYFEDVCAGGNAKTSLSVTPGSAASPPKRSKSSSQASATPHCQVEGCNLNLSSAKDYHRKHRVCESHSKCPKVIVGGLERRFCQQCSRFHGLSEFDEKKRSCRRRLSDHNARRRKPQPGSIHLNPGRPSSSLYDERSQMSIVLNSTPFIHSRANANLPWEGTSSSKFTITKEYPLKPAKVGGIEGHLHLPANELTTSFALHRHDSKGALSSKAKIPTTELLSQGLEESIISSNVDTAQDLHRALSLLSTNTWDSYEPKSISHEQRRPQTSHTGMPHSVLHAMPQGLPLDSSDYWRTEQQITKALPSTLENDSGSYYQEFQLLRAPYDNDFYTSQLN